MFLFPLIASNQFNIFSQQFLPVLTSNCKPRGARSGQEQPEAATRSQEEPVGDKSGQQQPGGAKRSQEQPGAARSRYEESRGAGRRQEWPEVARRSQDEPGGAKSNQEQSGQWSMCLLSWHRQKLSPCGQKHKNTSLTSFLDVSI